MSKAQVRDKAYKLNDADGLFLLVKPQSGRHSRLNDRLSGRDKTLPVQQKHVQIDVVFAATGGDTMETLRAITEEHQQSTFDTNVKGALPPLSTSRTRHPFMW